MVFSLLGAGKLKVVLMMSVSVTVVKTVSKTVVMQVSAICIMAMFDVSTQFPEVEIERIC
jgi:hypothetical protein